MCPTSSTSPLLSNHRRSLSPEPGMLQPAARVWQRRMSRVHPIVVLHHARHQLHSESSTERLECPRLEARSAGYAYLSSYPVPIKSVLHDRTTGSSVPPTMRRPSSEVSSEASYHSIRSRQTVADLPTTVQPSTTRTALHVSCHRVEKIDRTHSVQILLSRSVHCFSTINFNVHKS